jgi:hypothetical protein
MPGRKTLMTTSRPSAKRAACTCAIEAEAKGCASNSANSIDYWLSQRALDLRNRHGAVEGRDLILQHRQLIGDVGGQQVAPRGENLSELHEDRTQRLQRQGANAVLATPAPLRRWRAE